jgi:hypothetical protein
VVIYSITTTSVTSLAVEDKKPNHTMPRTINIIVRSVCCSKIKGKVDEEQSDEEVVENDESE